MKRAYQAPTVEQLVLQVEQGFAQSVGIPDSGDFTGTTEGSGY